MRLTVIGSADAFNSSGRGHSCYLLDGAGLEVDLGQGRHAAHEQQGREHDPDRHRDHHVEHDGEAEAGEELVNALVELDELVPVSGEVLFRKQDYDSMVARVHAALKDKGQITHGEVRDMFNTSRKYAQALLEHLDATGITRRDGDFRRLK